MTQTQWKIQFDWDRDGSFGEAYDDLTPRVIKAKWAVGMSEPYQDVAGDTLLHLTLRNEDRFFSPENTSSPIHGKLHPHIPVHVLSDDGTTERVMWTDWISQIKPTVGQYGERLTEIIAGGAQPFYTATETKIELQENKRTDEIIAQLISEVVYPPNMAGVFIVGVAGYNMLGVNTRLGEPAGSTALEAGVLTLGYAADNWVRQGGYTNQTQDGFDAIRQLMTLFFIEFMTLILWFSE